MRVFPSALPSLVSLILLTSAIAPLLAQQTPTPDAASRALPIVLHDKHGTPQTAIHKEDLQLLVDSRPATVLSVESDAKAPLKLGLLIETSKRQEEVVPAARKPEETFLDEHATRPGDQAFVLHFDKEIELMQDLTAEKAKLHSAVEDLRPATDEATDDSADSNDSDSSDDSDDRRRRKKPSGIKLYDAIFLASDEILQKPTGRKAIVVISDGEDRGSKESLASAVESAQRTGTVVYTVYVEGEREKQDQRRGNQNGGQQQRRSGGGIGWPSSGGGYPGGQGGGQGGGQTGGGNGRGGQKQKAAHEDGRKILLEISKKTGGAMFESKKKEDIGSLLTQISQYFQAEYLMTFRPDADSTGSFHRVSATANKSGWSVQVPEAYYSGH